MTCADVRAMLDAYLAGKLSDAQSVAIETHAASCAECEAVLEAATAIPVHAFDPPLPSALRKRTLARIAERTAPVDISRRDYIAPRTSPRNRRWRWLVAASGIAAAAAVTLMVGRDGHRSPALVPDTVALASPDTSVSVIAETRARPELAEIARAEQEVRDALVRAPNDGELRTFLRTLDRRRDELTRRVKESGP